MRRRERETEEEAEDEEREGGVKGEMVSRVGKS